jgi:arsenate reductase
VKRRPVVLFLCTHNSGRSIAAMVLLQHYAAGEVDVRSAGSDPASELNPSVLALLEERGLSPLHAFPKPLTEADALESDLIVTMGCEDTCPVYPAKHYEEWDLRDPAGFSIEEVRPIVDEIERRVLALMVDLARGTPTRS